MNSVEINISFWDFVNSIIILLLIILAFYSVTSFFDNESKKQVEFIKAIHEYDKFTDCQFYDGYYYCYNKK